jgi:hypothetical protein
MMRYTEAEVWMSNLLRDAWSDADSHNDDEESELCKRALTALELPWVAIHVGDPRVP